MVVLSCIVNLILGLGLYFGLRKRIRLFGIPTWLDCKAIFHIILRSHLRSYFFRVMTVEVLLLGFCVLVWFKKPHAILFAYTAFLAQMFVMSVLWFLDPPIILFLAASSTKAHTFLIRCYRVAAQLRIVSFLEFKFADSKISEDVSTHSLRIRNSETWSTEVGSMMRIAPIILVYCEDITPAVRIELTQIVQMNLCQKVMLIGNEHNHERMLNQLLFSEVKSALQTMPIFSEDEAVKILEDKLNV